MAIRILPSHLHAIFTAEQCSFPLCSRMESSGFLKWESVGNREPALVMVKFLWNTESLFISFLSHFMVRQSSSSGYVQSHCPRQPSQGTKMARLCSLGGQLHSSMANRTWEIFVQTSYYSVLSIHQICQWFQNLFFPRSYFCQDYYYLLFFLRLSK